MRSPSDVRTTAAWARLRILFISGYLLGAANSPTCSGQQPPRTAAILPIATDNNDSPNLDNNEPSIAVNPRNPKEIAVVTFSEGWNYLETQPKMEDMAPIWKSRDGGRTWKKIRQIPCPRIGYDGPGDQKVAYDENGKLVVAEMLKGGKPPRCYIFRQTNNDPDAPLTSGQPFGYDQPLLDLNNSGRGSRLYCAHLT